MRIPEATYPDGYCQWRNGWRDLQPLLKGADMDFVEILLVSAWNQAINYAEHVVFVEFDGSLLCPDCKRDIKANVKIEETNVSVKYDEKEESFNYDGELTAERTDHNVATLYCLNCGWLAKNPRLVSVKTGKEL